MSFGCKRHLDIDVGLLEDLSDKTLISALRRGDIPLGSPLASAITAEIGSRGLDPDPEPIEGWQFKSAGMANGLRAVEDGLKLPSHLGSRTFVRSVRLKAGGFDATQARRPIRIHGFVCYD